MNNYLKFGLLIAVILGTLAWLAIGGISETKTYYLTIAEVNKLPKEVEKGNRVGGDVEPNSIVREGKFTKFTLAQDNLRLNVVYTGTEPLPDTFKDGSQAL